jgi:peptidoglycan hydrolase CwlO-like protein
MDEARIAILKAEIDSHERDIDRIYERIEQRNSENDAP